MLQVEMVNPNNMDPKLKEKLDNMNQVMATPKFALPNQSPFDILLNRLRDHLTFDEVEPIPIMATEGQNQAIIQMILPSLDCMVILELNPRKASVVVFKIHTYIAKGDA